MEEHFPILAKHKCTRCHEPHKMGWQLIISPGHGSSTYLEEGWASPKILFVATARLAASVTGHSGSRAGMNLGWSCLGFDSAMVRGLATALRGDVEACGRMGRKAFRDAPDIQGCSACNQLRVTRFTGTDRTQIGHNHILSCVWHQENCRRRNHCLISPTTCPPVSCYSQPFVQSTPSTGDPS